MHARDRARRSAWVGLVVGQLELPGSAGAARRVEGDAQARALAEGVGEGRDADADLGPVAAPPPSLPAGHRRAGGCAAATARSRSAELALRRRSQPVCTYVSLPSGRTSEIVACRSASLALDCTYRSRLAVPPSPCRW